MRLGANGAGYERIQCPTMIVAGWADGYRNNSFRTLGRAREARRTAPAARRAVGARRPADGDPGAADRPRRGAGRVVRPLAAAVGRRRRVRVARRRLRPRLHPARARPGDARGLLAPAPARAADPAVLRPARRPPPAAGRPRHRHDGLDRLRRAPAVGTVDRPAARRRALADLGRRPAVRSRWSASRARCSGSAPTPRRRRCR